MTNAATLRIGNFARFTHPTSNGGHVTFLARVVKIDGDYAWVEMPRKVRTMPFAPLGGKRYGKYLAASLTIA